MFDPRNEDIQQLPQYEALLMAGLSADIYHAAALTFEGISGNLQPDFESKKFVFNVNQGESTSDITSRHNTLYNIDLPPSLSNVFVGDSVRDFEIEFITEGDKRPDLTIVMHGQNDRTVILRRRGAESSQRPFECTVNLESGKDCTGDIPCGDISLFLLSLSFDPATRKKFGDSILATIDIQDQEVASGLLQPHTVTESETRFDEIPVINTYDTTVSLTQTITPSGDTSYQAGLRRTVISECETIKTTDEYAISLPAIEQRLDYLLRTYDHTQVLVYTWAPDRPVIFQEEKYPDPSVLSYMIAALNKANPKISPTDSFEEYIAERAKIDDAPASPEELEDYNEQLIPLSEADTNGATNHEVLSRIVDAELELPEDIL